VLPPRNILIVRLSAIGDVVHVLPCLHALREAFPKARIGWVVEELSAPLLQGHPEIDDLFAIPKKRWRAHPIAAALSGEKRAFYRRLRAGGWDVAVDFQGLTKSGWVARLSGARVRIGFAGKDGRELNRLFTNCRVTPPDTARHVIQRNIALLEPLGIRNPAVEWRFPEWGEERRQLAPFFDDLYADAPPDKFGGGARSGEGASNESDSANRNGRIRGFIALIPGAGWETKRWPAEHFAALARILAGQDRDALAVPDRIARAPQILVGGPSEEALCREILQRAQLPPERLRMAPPTNLRQLAALLQRAAVVAGGDTGPLHLAAALGAPVVGIYGASDPTRNGPWGERAVALEAEGGAPKRCWRTRCNSKTTPLQCLRSISPERVARAIADNF
jgi:heptosyltransferase-1